MTAYYFIAKRVIISFRQPIKMKQIASILLYCALILFLCTCGKKSSDVTDPQPPIPTLFSLVSSSINNQPVQANNYGTSINPIIQLKFLAAINRSSVPSSIILKDNAGSSINFNTTYANSDSTLIITPIQPLNHLTKYFINTTTQLKSTNGGNLNTPSEFSFITTIDPVNKFPVLTDDELLTLVQRQTFKYFWDFAHPTSGLARERNTSGEVVTSGGSGFGIMAIVTGISRNFISRSDGLARLQKIVGFLKNNAQTFHGAFPHWLNGTTGAVVPFSQKDNGADLVETSYLMQGLLTARQFFNGSDAAETGLRNDINTLWRAVEWSWFRKGTENVLYWHWSPNYNWEMNHPIKGWNEALITYILGASSLNYSIPKTVYDNGWASNGSMKNGNSYYGLVLPLGPPNGGPLFFAHYSFLGINPRDLSDAYANYWTQNTAHTIINYNYSKANPKGWFGYSDSCWGLTASDNQNGYAAHEPNNDLGVISPTAALSSFPYTPIESMKALKFFYYRLGDKMWGEYGFKDAFNLSIPWFASSYLAIDQGPIIIMIENHRTGLLWNLFMSCPEVKTGMKNLGFQSPHL